MKSACLELYVLSEISNIILNLTGTQWKEAKTGEIYSLLTLIGSLAAAFWIKYCLVKWSHQTNPHLREY